MEKVYEFLKQFGLSDLETKLYLGLLETGPTTVLEIAKHTGIKRTTAHVNIETLIEKGLVAQTKSGTRRKILAEEPEKLRYILEQRKLDMKSMETGLPNILETLAKSVLSSANRDNNLEVKYFEGKTGIQRVYQEAFKATDYRSYVNLGEINKVMPQNQDIYLETHRGKKDYRVREILDGSEETVKKATALTKDTNFDFKVANFKLNLDAINILIYDDKVAVVNYKNQMFASIIQNKEFNEFSQNLFDYVWETLPERK